MALEKKERIINYWSEEAERYSGLHASGMRAEFRKKEFEINLRLLELKPGEVVLDAGCGSGITSAILLGEKRKVMGIDFSERMVEEARKHGIDARIDDISTMDLLERFDKILAAGVFEYVICPKEAMKNLSKHLKTGGRIVVVVPRWSFWGVGYFIFHLLKGMPIKLYSVRDLKTLFSDADLEVIKVENSKLALHMIGAKK